MAFTRSISSVAVRTSDRRSMPMGASVRSGLTSGRGRSRKLPAYGLSTRPGLVRTFWFVAAGFRLRRGNLRLRRGNLRLRQIATPPQAEACGYNLTNNPDRVLREGRDPASWQ